MPVILQVFDHPISAGIIQPFVHLPTGNKDTLQTPLQIVNQFLSAFQKPCGMMWAWKRSSPH